MKLLVCNIGIIFILFFVTGSYSGAEEHGRAYFEKTGDVIWDIKAEEKVIALTFDDGPHSVYTPQILDVLAKYNAKATFFVIGEHAKKFPHLISREKIEGHEIANHTYTHSYSNQDKLEEELRKTDEVIYNITGAYPLFYRPIGGEYNERIVNTAVQQGFRVIMWSWHQDTQDWKRPGVNKIVSKVLSGARPGDIVLFHDAGGDRSQTVEALQDILPALKKEGYTFVTVSELLQRTGIEVFN
ncbi:polysaccharide deacetylase family protein [Lederbergia lenta]|uniref:Polysaccharide deacetylase n=1 Tax=Lederbergia lenta TaxID=1467 RepID=A0A2X4YXQ8_LEDLE|nr:polysaccharide deacetylase family protein [Lederbergia lenta]MEC2326581.1 polysaccharide deacetylase family protein [Lederbergia lenta]SQI53134.1 polysaccharide deacetylase [Lederbergia lenta]